MTAKYFPGRNLRAAFSLPELMFVGAILAMLAILIGPARQKLRRQANAATNQTNIRAICLANLQYADERGYFAEANGDSHGDFDLYRHWVSRVAEYAGLPPRPAPPADEDDRFMFGQPPHGVFLRPGDTWVLGEANEREPDPRRYLSSYGRNVTFNNGMNSVRRRSSIQFRRQMRYPSEVWMISDLFNLPGDPNDIYQNPGFFGGYYTFGMGDASIRVFPAGQIPSIFGSEVANRRFWSATYPAPTSPITCYRFDLGLAYDGSEDSLTDAHDGVANLHKYAFNMIGYRPGQAVNLSRPNNVVLDAISGGVGLPAIRLNAQGHLMVSYIRRPSASFLNYEVQFCDDLAVGNWAANPAATASSIGVPNHSDAYLVTVTDSVPAAGRFARVMVIVQP